MEFPDSCLKFLHFTGSSFIVISRDFRVYSEPLTQLVVTHRQEYFRTSYETNLHTGHIEPILICHQIAMPNMKMQ